MRNVLLVMLASLPLLTYGQIIDHFSNTNSKWNVADTYPNANQQNPYFAETRTTIFGFVGDTLVNGEMWLKMYSTEDSLFISNLNFEGYIQSTSDQVLKADENFQIDTLYQFDLNVGDSINFDFGFYSEKIPVLSIDSVLIDNQYYKRLQFAEPTGPNAFTFFKEEWLEGIGSMHGPLFPDRPEVFSTEIPDSLNLICTASNGRSVWQHPSYSDCFVNIILGLTANDLSLFSVFPNPFQDEVSVSTASSKPKKVSIRNQLGQLVHFEIHDRPNFNIQVSELQNGLYFITIEENGKYLTWRVIKNNSAQ